MYEAKAPPPPDSRSAAFASMTHCSMISASVSSAHREFFCCGRSAGSIMRSMVKPACVSIGRPAPASAEPASSRARLRSASGIGTSMETEVTGSGGLR